MFDDESETISENIEHAEELESNEQKRNQTSTIKSPLVKALLLKKTILTERN
jgi:hypothetical protein